MIALLLAILPPPAPTVDRCDAIEVNHVYDDAGCHVFSQVIFWSGGEVRDWRLRKSVRIEHHGDHWRATWHDGETWRRVEAVVLSRSWTQHDRELTERLRCPVRERWGLTPCDNRPRTNAGSP